VGKYRLSVPAQSDFIDIGRYTQSRWGARQRHIYLGQLIEAFKTLAENPNMGRPRDAISAGLLVSNAGSHAIYFRRIGNVVEIARILHGRQSPKKAFP
jgi:toxin ParE1/3/4